MNVVPSSCVICLRSRPGKSPRSFKEYFEHEYGTLREGFCNDEEGFTSGWEVLLGQSTVVNWVRSKSASEVVQMRYPGEFKLAGGHVEEGETLEYAAKRELIEEFFPDLTFETIKLRPFSVKQTKPVRMRSHLMYNFVALEEENSWMKSVDIHEINSDLRKRIAYFEELIALDDCDYWKKSNMEKELLSPEVHMLRWVPLEVAMGYCLSSEIPGTFVNAWQKKKFEQYNIKSRDPMIMTGASLLELEKFQNIVHLKAYSESADLPSLKDTTQWLFDGMSEEEMQEALKLRQHSKKSALPTLSEIVSQRDAFCKM